MRLHKADSDESLFRSRFGDKGEIDRVGTERERPNILELNDFCLRHAEAPRSSARAIACRSPETARFGFSTSGWPLAMRRQRSSLILTRYRAAPLSKRHARR